MKTSSRFAQWDYLSPAASAAGRTLRRWLTAGQVEADDLAPLEEAHGLICRREDLPALRRWLDGPPASAQERQRQRGVRVLLRLLEMLGRQGLPPFHAPLLSTFAPPARPIAAGEPSPVLDDGAAANASGGMSNRFRLRYLVACARRLDLHSDWDALADFVDQVTEQQFNALADAADTMRRRGDLPALRHAARLTGAGGSREAALLRSLLHVMDALDIF